MPECRAPPLQATRTVAAVVAATAGAMSAASFRISTNLLQAVRATRNYKRPSDRRRSGLSRWIFAFRGGELFLFSKRFPNHAPVADIDIFPDAGLAYNGVTLDNGRP